MPNMSDMNYSNIEAGFYRNVRECSTDFRNLDDKRKKYLQELSDSFKSFTFTDNKLENYFATIYFFESPRAIVSHVPSKYDKYFYNFDEAFYFFIYTLDPECIMAKMYLNNEEHHIRSLFGFYNKNIITLELQYLKSIDTELTRNVKIYFSNVEKTINIFCSLMKGINLTQERYEQLKLLAQEWNQNQLDNKPNTCLYNVYYQHKLLGLNWEYEKLVFTILALDPTFRLLELYEYESNYNVIKEKAIKELGFYIYGLIKAEDLICKTFNTEVDINRWSK